MGVTEALARYAARRAHVLVAEVTGHWLVRVAVERDVVRRGWRVAESPADADILAVCGEAGPEMAKLLARLWEQMPGPRVRVDIHDEGAVESTLTVAAAQLADPRAHRLDAGRRPASPDPDSESSGDNAMDHGAHGEMDHGEMEMAPSGIPLADGGEDRDGLEMDVLHLRLGPVLPHWPAGLVLCCSLQGDVITDAEATQVDHHHVHARRSTEPSLLHDPLLLDAAYRCDNVANLLALAGWDDAAVAARKIRNSLLTDADPPKAAVALETLGRKVNGSRLLRWSLRGIRSLTDGDLRRHSLPAHLRGDTRDRLASMLERACARMTDTTEAGRDRPAPPSVALGALPHLVTGLDLATARLVVASLDLDPLVMRREPSHG